ncbi:MAG TPA: MopE-related protein [Sandaracinaceae bacterium LLY-WYZ-13_1]|nr:MopE-related protein [Sandaracinaceae bacterium LLY-WYZ-13_1]
MLRRSLLACFLLASCLVAASASAQVAPRIVIAVDTSGSMALDLDGTPTFGDGVTTGCSVGGSGELCGTNCTAGIDTDCDGETDDSRIHVAKEAIRNMVLAFGDVDWSLARFSQNQGTNLSCLDINSYECNDAGPYVTSYGNPQCNTGASIPDGGFFGDCPFDWPSLWPSACAPDGTGGNPVLRTFASGSPTVCTNYDGVCSISGSGGDVLVGFPDRGAFAGMDNTYGILSWLNGTETNFVNTRTTGNFCDSAGTGDCELRPEGPTPLAGLLDSVGDYISPIRMSDPRASCRPYSVILITDGAESCGGGPESAASALSSAGIDTYVVGLAISGGARTQLNDIATAGGTDAGDPGGDTAFFADDPVTLSAGLSDIVRRSLLVETCNGADDDCDSAVDEGVLNACGSCGAVPAETCDGSDEDCDGSVDEGVANACGTCGPPPAETCNRLDDDCDGIIDEDGAGGDVCSGCTPTAEICDNIDNDCDGSTDEGLTRSCGTDVGECSPGSQTCSAGSWGTCSGGDGPDAETCNGLDDDCDGTIDGFSEPCGSDVGACVPGSRLCTGGSWGSCVGGVGPSPEVCDGIDNDCDPSTADGADDSAVGSTCGTDLGICSSGSLACMGGALTCVGGTGPDPSETCNGADDDCDGATDEGVPTMGACGETEGECSAGVRTCVGGSFTCVGARGPTAEICDGRDNDCDASTDEGNPGGGVTCGSSTGACTTGTSECVGGTLQCTGGTMPTTETCDGDDEDCDGTIDEGVPTMGACGESEGECNPGVRTCVLGSYACVGARGPTPEVCDALDNDCDASTDEGNPEGGATCGTMVGLCEVGTLTCVGGSLVCDGETGPDPETCDGADNDCDTLIDEGFFDGSPCGTDLGICVPGTRQCDTGGVIACVCPLGYALRTRADGTELCVPDSVGGGPLVEECNSFDDDCDGMIDEGLGVGGPCGSDEGLCMPGEQRCVDGRVVCVGEVGPEREGCDCDDNDCDGTVDEAPEMGALCPPGSTCVDCQCALPCDESEFGFTCPTGKAPRVGDDGMCFCVADRCDPDDCATQTIEQDEEVRCAPDSDDVSECVCKNNECTFPCQGVVCTEGTVCDPRDPLGRCVEDNCRGLGCPGGEICDRSTLECVEDPCASVTCEADEACRMGTCEPTCAGVECAGGEVCRSGVCEMDRCADASCGDDAVCDPESGECVSDLCAAVVCPRTEVCDIATGNCVADPCESLRCPEGTVCEEGECYEEEVEMPDAGVDGGVDGGPADDGRDRVLASGGCNCHVGATEPGSRGGAPWWLALGLLGLVAVRRRRRGRREGSARAVPFVAALVAAGAALTSGCDVDPFCLDCEDGVVDAGPEDGGRDAGRRDAGSPDAGADAGDAGGDACLEDELCNEMDDDCDGEVDEGIDTDTDVENCGACGNACTPEGAFPSCEGGECGIDRCDVGRHDLDDDPSNGCEYRCLPTGEDDSICDLRDNDCDGEVDEDIDTTTDPNHCGSCGRTCRFAHATAECVPEGDPPMGTCRLDECETGWADADGVEGTGCEYSCTPTSDPTEVCDAVDNDCDPGTDDGASDPALGTSCGSTEEGECAFGTYDRCEAGRLVCVGATEPTGELCNGLDDDCDASTDEGNPEGGAVCAGAVGVCVTGREQCTGGGLSCTCPMGFTLVNDPGRGDFCVPDGETLTEECNGLDDDCDGSIDEGNPEGGGTCGSNVGACTFGTLACRGGVLVCEGGTGPSVEVCDGVDNDCDPSTADGSDDARVGSSCGTDLGVCSPGTQQCAGGGLSCVCPSGYTLTTSGGAPYCVPSGSSLTELCNGLDDDCDGTVDDGNPEGGASCESSVGWCMSGTELCSGGTLVCDGFRGPRLEECNSIDDDCNGTVDDGFDTDTDVNNCGSCGNVCSFPNAVAGCTGGGCVLVSCLPGFVDLDPGAPGCEYACTVAGSEICNGRDDDCDGATDESLTPPSTFCNPNGVCAGTTPTCGGSAGWECSYGSDYEPTEVSCDGLDNDCNGLADEPFPTVGNSCSNGTGECRRTGVVACTSDGSGTLCTAPAAGTPAGFESCNDLDDDCDGSVDEDIPLSAIPTVLMPRPGGGTFEMMTYEASRPDATSSDAGAVETHACSNPDVLPWTNLTWSEARDACCALNPSGTCSGGGSGWRLCDGEDWEAACVGPTSSCDWSYGSSCATSAPLTCNGEEFDSDGSTAGDQDALYPTASTGFGMCFTDWGSEGVVYDLSGNVKEWTNTETAPDIHEIRGGAYNNVEPGRMCRFDFTVGDENFAFPNTGFRCCHY